MAAVGRITGPLLKNNLTRNGVPLAFETNLLYLDVVNSRVGINTASPTNDLTVNGTTRTTNLTVPGTSTLGTISFSSNNITSSSSVLNLSANGGTSPVVYQTTLQVGQLQLSNNSISTLGTQTLINIAPAGTGNININGPTTVNGSLHVTGNITADGNIQLGATFTILASGNYGEYTITVASAAGINVGYYVTGTGIGIGAVVTVINGNVLTLSQPNTSAISNLITVQANVTVSFTGEVASNLIPLTTNSYDIGASNALWRELWTETINAGVANIGNVTISGNTITTSVPNSDFTLQTNGSGGVVLGNLKITGSTITDTVADSNITLTPQGLGTVVINSTTSLQIPSGTNLQRPASPAAGQIRYNTDQSRYEGYTSGQWLQLGGVISNDGATRITPELTPGAADNTIRFYNNNVLTVSIDNTKLYTPTIQTANLQVTGATISSLSAGTDINITTTGAGGVVLGNLKYYRNSLTNIQSGGITLFSQTGTGYVKLAGSNGVVLPYGNSTTDRPVVYEVGMIRFNTDSQYVEVWNGTAWTSVAGTSAGVTAATAQDIGIALAISLG